MSQPPFVPPISLTWLDRAREVAGDAGLVVAMLIWRECRLGHTRKHHSRGTRDGFVKLSHARACRFTSLHARTFARKVDQLAAAGLVEIHRPGPKAARQVRVVAVPGEEYWTRAWLGI